MTNAQSLRVELPKYAGQTIFISAAGGMKQDTLGSVKLDARGIGTLQYTRVLTGMAALTVKDNKDVGFDFILSPAEKTTIHCDGAYMNPQSTHITGSPENERLYRWSQNFMLLARKEGVGREMALLYDSTSAFGRMLKMEVQQAGRQLKLLRDTIDHSASYAGRYMRFRLAQGEILGKVWENNDTRTKARNYFLHDIDFEALYGSNIWFDIMNACIEAYTKEGAYYEKFGDDVVSILSRIKNDTVYTALADAALSITERFSWPVSQTVIVNYVVGANRIPDVQSKLKKIIDMQRLQPGNLAPDLVITEHIGKLSDHNHKTTMLPGKGLSSKYSLLIFYLSGCGPCETTMQLLRNNYADLKEKGVRLISLSGDEEEAVFANNSKDLPWPDKYCDFEGKQGVNFKSYAVLGTPTMYLLDSNGIILNKFATVEELLAFWKKS